MKRGATIAAAWGLLLASCASVEVPPGEARPLKPEQGWLILACDSKRNIDTITLCRPRTDECHSVGPFRGSDELRVLALPAGRWCAYKLVAYSGAVGLVIEPGGPFLCTTVASGRSSYPGHIALDYRPTSTTAVGFGYGYRQHRARVRRLLARDHPAVLVAWPDAPAEEPVYPD